MAKEIVFNCPSDMVEEHIEWIECYPERVQKTIWDFCMYHLNNWLTYVDSCESPIEQMMVLPLLEASQDTKKLPYVRKVIFGSQVNISVSKQRLYRVDFLISVELIDNSIYPFIIECDGHDFHEKTKEQAAKDKKRDRELMALGYRVIRFTGSEIYDDPFMRVQEAKEIIYQTIQGKAGE